VKDLLPFIVAGVISGSLYGLAATGLALSYKTSGIFIFAHGAVAAACTFCFYELRTVRGLPWPLALAVAVLVFAPLVGLVIERIGRSLQHADSASRIVATVGLLLAVQGATELMYGQAPLDFAPLFPTRTFRVFGVYVGYDQLITLLISLVCVGLLQLFFRRSRLGLEMRGVVDNRELLGLIGSSPVTVQRAAWAISCAFAALSGILLASSIGLNATLLTLLVVQAFGAAAVGRFRHIGLTYGAAIGIGIVTEIIKKFVPSHPGLAGLPTSVPFLILFGVLVLSRADAFRSAEPRRRTTRAPRVPPTLRWAIAAAVPLLVLAVPSLVGAKLTVYTNGAIYVVLFVSLGLLVRLSGQVSLCTMSFAAVGATTFSHLTAGAGLPWLPAALIASIVVVPIGALLAIPAIRLSSLYLGLATFGFAILVQQFAFGTPLMFGATDERTAARPNLLGMTSDRGFFYLCALVAVACVIAAVVISRSRLGRLLRGLADSPVALSTHGTDVNITRVLIFCLSSFMAGLGGVLLIALTGTARGSGTVFNFLQSLVMLAVLTIAGRSLVLAPVLAAGLLTVLPAYSTNVDLASYQLLAFGVVAILIVTVGPALSDWMATAGPASAWRRRSSPARPHRFAVPAPTSGTPS